MKSYATASDKVLDITRMLDSSSSPDWTTLRHFCVSQFGLVNDYVRVRVWPLLLGLTATTDGYYPSTASCSRFEQQIEVDIVRSLRNFDLLKRISTEERTHRAEQLTRIITQILSEDSQLHYFQGFHDICTVFLLIAEETLGLRLVHRFVTTHCRDSMRPSFDEVSRWMSLIPVIVSVEDVELSCKMRSLQQDVTCRQIPMFALGWVITFFAHAVPCFQEVARIYDFCLGTHPQGVLYLVSGVVLLSKGAVMSMSDLSDLHKHFSEAVRAVDWDVACLRADHLMHMLPPRHLCYLKQKAQLTASGDS